MKKILFIPPEPWYIENYVEYLIRFFGHKYFMEMAHPGNQTENQLYRNPDDYDLLIPLLATHPHVDTKQYKNKMAAILWEPAEGCWQNTKIVAATTPIAVNSMKRLNHPFVYVLPGIDLNLFQPKPLIRNDYLLRIGIVGCIHNVRHRIKEVVLPLFDIPGVRFMFFTRNYFIDRQNDIEAAGGGEVKKRVINANRNWTGVPNIYNSVDVILRVDADPGLTFPILEAMACGISWISTEVGIESEVANSGIIIKADQVDVDGNGRNWYYQNTDEVINRCRQAIEWMRDNPDTRKEMGKTGRKIMEEKYTWEAQLPKWEEFFERALYE